MTSLLSAIVWEMDPVIIDLGGLQIRYYGLLWGLGIFAAYYFTKKLYLNEKEDPNLMDPLLYACLIGAILGARLGHVIFYQSELFSQDIVEVFLPISMYDHNGDLNFEFTGFSGLASHGGAAGILLAIIWYKYKKSKQTFLWILDKVAYPVAATSFFIRIANFFNSEIVGVPTGSSHGVVFRALGEDFPRHPAQLYEAICFLAIFFFLRKLYWKDQAYKTEGKLIGWFFILTFVSRFMVEFVKKSQGGIGEYIDNVLSTGQILSLPFIAIGVYLVFYRKSENLKA